jgi:deoxynucleoside triphosphate triphosphohydrolase SAMHD1
VTQTDLTDFHAFVDRWTEDRLQAYLAGLETRPDKSCQHGKEFNDAIWTTVFLRPLEVLLLDSPLLQRLRHIRQLGVVHLVYPSATHTRLEHSLGAVHQVSALISGINGPDALIEDSLESLMRVAALCHDIGHGVMSHVSENALAGFPSTRRLIRSFQKEFRLEKIKPSEIAAFYMVRSPAFSLLVAEAQRISGEHDLPADAPTLIAHAIIGKQFNTDVPLLHELISGPFDADKLDYMTRDARQTGVPVVTDIPRLVQKVRGRQMTTTEVPEEIRKTIPGETTTCVMTGVALSGGRTLDELVFGHTLLFDKIYRHQKVRAAEAMVAGILDQIARLSSDGVLSAPYKLVDGQIFDLDTATIEKIAGRELAGDGEKTRANVALDISRRLRERILFRRAYAFAQNMPLDPYRSDDTHRLGLVELANAARRPDWRKTLLPKVVAATKEILGVLEEEDVLDGIPDGDIAPYIWIDPPKAKTQSNETPRAYLISDAAKAAPIMPFRDEYAETPGWSNAYLLTRDTGYVFTIDELALPVYLAMERLARIEYGVRSPAAMIPYAKHDPQALDRAKRKLENAGFYSGTPFDIRPEPPRFSMADFPSRLEAMRLVLSTYQGPVYEAQEKKRSTIMSEGRIRSFVRQFGLEHAEEALSLLQRLRIIGRPELIAAVRSYLSGTDKLFSSAVPLGEAKDSSSVTTYEAGDIDVLKVRGLRSALGHEGSILFAEDFVGTGNQTISLLENLLGVEPTVDLHEEREDALPPDVRDLLMSRQLAIVFSCGRREGAEAVKAAGQRLNLNLDVYLHEAASPSALDASAEFLERCREIGRQLLEDDDPNHDAAWVEERILGYGNQAFLIAFPYNTPTQALTCLWKAGVVDGVEWVPLLPRRPKR